MKILFIAQFYPYPPTTGGLSRIFNLVKEIGSRHDVTFVVYRFPDEVIKSEHIKEMEKHCREVVVITANPMETKRPSTAFMIKRLLFGNPWFVPVYSSKESIRVMKDLAESEHFDIVHIESLGLAHLKDIFKQCPVVLGQQNIEAQILQRRIRHMQNVKKKLIAYLDYRKLDRFEKKMLPLFDHVIAVSDQDAMYFKKHNPDLAVTIVPNGVDIKYFVGTKNTEEKEWIVFTGLMNWSPNEDAVCYFVQKVLPIIKKQLPNIVFSIVGMNPTAKVKALASDSSVEVTGFVEDVRPYVLGAKVFVVPIRFGGGTRLKILEAMAMGAAVVSTTIGCEGLEVKDGVNLIIRDEPQQLADAIIELMGDADRRTRLGQAARKLVEEKYDWKNIAVKLEQAYIEAIAQFRGR